MAPLYGHDQEQLVVEKEGEGKEEVNPQHHRLLGALISPNLIRLHQHLCAR